MNKVNHIAIIMDGNGRWGKKKEKAETMAILMVSKLLKKLLRNQ